MATQADRLKNVEDAVTDILKRYTALAVKLEELDVKVSAHHKTPDAHHPAIVASRAKK